MSSKPFLGSGFNCSDEFLCSDYTCYSTGGASFLSLFSQPSQRQLSEQPTPELKHSQQRFRQCDFLQLHRFSERLQLRMPPSLMPVLAAWMSCSKSSLFLQERQAQSSPHFLDEEKHSQYILRQKVFLQVQPSFFFLEELVAVCTKEQRSAKESSCWSCLLGEWGMSMFSGQLGKALMVLIILRERCISGMLSMDGNKSKVGLIFSLMW